MLNFCVAFYEASEGGTLRIRRLAEAPPVPVRNNNKFIDYNSRKEYLANLLTTAFIIFDITYLY